MRTKYIVGELPVANGTVLGAVAFPEYLEHAAMAQVFAANEELVSAGFFRVEGGEVQPYGESVSLRLPSRPEDAQIIAKAIGLHPRSR